MTITNTYKGEYLVVWADDCGVIQSKVCLGIRDPHQMENNDWIFEAAKSEGYSDKEAQSLVERGYDLYLVSDFPSAFYDD